ncbi:MAG: class I SAM-dependent methyltransferase [Flavobacteriales bacterium]|nr:class I SAM-dependent methyltransferase [Flavobacteriales bacterium]
MGRKENERPASYHDLVIKDGRFIGRFEEMYQHFDQPWMQDKQPNPYSRASGILHMQRFGIRSLVEVGCGLGYYADRIHKATGARYVGIDVAPTAVAKAKAHFPHLDFRVDEVKNLAQYTDFQPDAILFAEVTWYVLDQLDALFKLMLTHYPGKYFIHNLVFYKGTQRYGTEHFTNLKEFMARAPFTPLGWMEATTEADSTIETSSIFRIERRT